MTNPVTKILPRSWRRNWALTFTLIAIGGILFLVYVTGSGIADFSSLGGDNDPILEGERHSLDESIKQLQKEFQRVEAELKEERFKADTLNQQLADSKAKVGIAEAEAELKFEVMKAKVLNQQLENARGQKTQTTRATAVESADNFLSLQEKRRQLIDEVCKRSDKPVGLVNTVITSTELTYCVLHNPTNTFWLQMLRFAKLDFVPSSLQSPPEIPRKESLNRAFKKLKKSQWLKLSQGEKSFIIRSNIFISVQDPLQRLWETYLEEFMMAQKWFQVGVKIEAKRQKTLKSKLNQCGTTVTFEEFIEHALSSYEPEYTSYYRQCDPCQLPPSYIVKEETWLRDSQYVLRYVKLDNMMTQSNFTDDRNFYYIRDVISENLDKLQVAVAQGCVKPQEMGARLGKFFAMMGVIPVGVASPVIDVNTKKDELIATFKDLYVVARQGRLDRATQKKTYFVQAYHDMMPSIMSKIKEKYKMDFELFDYSDSPPDVF